MTGLLRRPGAWFAAACLLLTALAAAAWRASGVGLAAQTAAERWQRTQAFSQVSVFFSDRAAVDDGAVLRMRGRIDEALAAIDMSPQSGGPIWTDAYSAQTELAAAAGENARPARVICTGGDFFAFHPLVMAAGWYYTDEDLSDSLVVLDEPMAWQLFGSSDVTGMTVTLEGWPCTVAGVAETPRQRDESAAYGEAGTIYMSYSLCARLGRAVPVTCYEALLPEAVGGFALQTVTGALTAESSDWEAVQNTGRFRPGRSLAGLGQLSRRVQRTGQVYFPYWENAARAAETRAALWAGLAAAAVLWPCLYGGYWAIRGGAAAGRKCRRAIQQRKSR